MYPWSYWPYVKLQLFTSLLVVLKSLLEFPEGHHRLDKVVISIWCYYGADAHCLHKST